MKTRGETQVKDLEVRKKNMGDRNTSLRSQVSFLKLRLESKRQQLAEDEVSSGLEAQELRIRQYGQTLHSLRSFVDQKTLETDFSMEKNTCIEFASQINKMLQDPR